MSIEVKVWCNYCKGTGQRLKKQCKVCYGDGYLYHTYYEGTDIDDMKERCAMICQGIGDKRVKSSWRVGEQCAEAIRRLK